MKSRKPEEPDSFRMRAVRFIKDPRTEVLTGERRKTPDETVMRVKEIAEQEGFVTAVFPDLVDCMQIIFFLDWEGSTQAMERCAELYPDADIIFGQHLCHQVPALVRFRRSAR